MQPQTRIDAWIVDLCRREPRLDIEEIAAVLDTDPDARRALGEHALSHGVFGHVLRRLEDANVALPHGEGLREFLGSLKIFRQQAALWDLELERVLRTLSGAGLAPVLLKGLALRQGVYQDPVLRPIGDFDFLFEPSEVPGAIETLGYLGYLPESEAISTAYAEHHFHQRLIHPNGFIVEVHWALTRGDDPFRVDAQPFLRDAVLQEGPGGMVRVPRPEDILLHMAAQGVEDGFAKLGRLVDIDRLTRAHELDWERILLGADAGGIESVLALALQLCARLLDSPIPRDVHQALRPSSWSRVHIALMDPEDFVVRQRGRTDHGANRSLRLWLVRSGRERLRRGPRIVFDAEDPMAWVWAAQQGRPMAPRWLHLLRSGASWGVHMLGFYGRSAATSITGGGRTQLRFWDVAPTS